MSHLLNDPAHREHSVRWSCAAAVVLLAACLVPGSSAEAAKNPRTEIRAHSHAFRLEPATLVTARLTERKPEVCATKRAARAGAARTMGLKRALAGAERFLARKAGRKALPRLYRNRALRKPKGAASVAAGGVVAGNPAGALAALLRAQKLAPKDPGTLVNMAPLLTHLGLAP